MPITRTPIIDDDGTGTTGTSLDNAWKQQLYDQIDGVVTASDSQAVIPIANGGSNVFDVVLPTPRPIYYVHVTASSAPITIRSLTAGRSGDIVIIQSIGFGHPVWLQFGENLPTDLFNRVRSGPTPLSITGSAVYVWSGIWRLAQHDQGQAIRVPYNAANYSGGGGTWTVEAGDVGAHDYFLRGNVLTVTFAFRTTTVSGPPSNLFVTGVPLANQSPALVGPALIYSGSTWLASMVQAEGGIARFAFNPISGAVPTGTNVVEVHGNMTSVVT